MLSVSEAVTYPQVTVIISICVVRHTVRIREEEENFAARVRHGQVVRRCLERCVEVAHSAKYIRWEGVRVCPRLRFTKSCSSLYDTHIRMGKCTLRHEPYSFSYN